MSNTIFNFLGCETPTLWVDYAIEHIPLLLIDHANCELKAALSALSYIHRYLNNQCSSLLSRLAREELSHFDKVIKLMEYYDVKYQKLSASRYAKMLQDHISLNEPVRSIDSFIVNAFIEARSCERFHVLAPRLNGILAKFYKKLYIAESRHFELYINLAHSVSSKSNLVHERIEFFRTIELELIKSNDDNFRFHSGVVVDIGCANNQQRLIEIA